MGKSDAKNIQQLLHELRKEIDALYQAGALDGTGLLYRGTTAYATLKNICTQEELMVIDDRFGPPTAVRRVP